MSATAPIRLRAGEGRWSLACKCPRMAVYAKRGAPARTRSLRENRILHRGKLFGRFVAEQFAERYGDENVLFEKEVPWRAGTLHTDVFVIPDRAAFEVKSSTAPESIIDGAIIQNAGEQHFDPDCDKGGVILVDPVDLDERVIPVVMTDELTGRVEDIAEQMDIAERTGDLPPRVCEKPTDGFSRMCPFIDTCFAGWEAPPPVPASELAEPVEQLFRLEQKKRAAKADEKTYDAEIARLRNLLRDRVEAGREYDTGSLKFKRIEVRGRETYDVTTALKSGAVAPELVEPFKKTGKPHERWSFDQTGELKTPEPTVDYGDVPF